MGCIFCNSDFSSRFSSKLGDGKSSKPEDQGKIKYDFNMISKFLKF